MNKIDKQHRIDTFGEVFSPESLVNEMLDKLPIECWTDSTKTWLEPPCGTGNFIVEIIRRLQSFGHSNENISKRIYGIELLEDNLLTTHQRMIEMLGESNRKFVLQRVVQGDTLNFDWSKFDELTS